MWSAPGEDRIDMRSVLTRVKCASVTIDGETVGKIGQGFLILLGVGPNDTEQECRLLAEKALGLRIFEDENGKINPSFAEAAPPELGNALYEKFLSVCEELGYPPQHGRFGADMKVESLNDGPVTLILDTDQLQSPRHGGGSPAGQ